MSESPGTPTSGKRRVYRSTVWLPEHKRKRNTMGSYSGVSHRRGVVTYNAGCDCGATFRGTTRRGQQAFTKRHLASCPEDTCECCGRPFHD